MREIPESFPGPVVVLEPGGGIVNVNDLACTLLESSRGELIGRNVKEILLPEEFERVTDITRANFGNWVFRWNGKMYDLFYFSLPGSAEEKEIFLMGLKLSPDVSWEFREHLAAMKGFVDYFWQADIGLLVVDGEGRYVHANEIILKIVGKNHEEIIGERVANIRPEYRLLVLEAMERQQIMKEVVDCDLSDGRYYFDITAIPIMKIGEVLGGLSLVVDVTDKVNLQRRLIDSDRMSLIGQMAARIMHDVRNPLQIVKSSVQILNIWNEKGVIEKEKQRIMLNNIDMAVNNVIELMNDMLQFSKPVSDKMELVRLKDFLERLASMLSPSFNKLGINFRLDIPSEYEIFCNRKLMRQAILNIVQNAIEVLQEYGGERKLIIRCYEGAEKLYLEIFNSGPLIEEKIIGKIFEAFFSTKGTKGTGLGLAITKEIVEKAHRGRISCVSSLENRGTSFIIEFPKIGETIQKTSQLG